MAHLTKAQQKQLELALASLMRGFDFIQDPTVAVCRRKESATTTLDYTRSSDMKALGEINKEIGSNLTGIPDGIHLLLQFIASNTK